MSPAIWSLLFILVIYQSMSAGWADGLGWIIWVIVSIYSLVFGMVSMTSFSTGSVVCVMVFFPLGVTGLEWSIRWWVDGLGSKTSIWDEFGRWDEEGLVFG